MPHRKVVEDYKLNVHYETEGTDPNDEPATQEEEKVTSDAVYEKM